jgi:hypothetical protein
MPQTSIRQSRSGAYAGQLAEEMHPLHIRTGIVADNKTVLPGQPTIITGRGPTGEAIVRPIENGDVLTPENAGGFVKLDTLRENESSAGYGEFRSVSLVREGVMYVEAAGTVADGNPVYVGTLTAQLTDLEDAPGTGLQAYPGARWLEDGSANGLVRIHIRQAIAAHQEALVAKALPAFAANAIAVPSNPETGTVYDVPTTAGASTITLPAAAAEGTEISFVADGTKNGHTVQFVDATGTTNLTTALTASKRLLVKCIHLNDKWYANAYIGP